MLVSDFPFIALVPASSPLVAALPAALPVVLPVVHPKVQLVFLA